MIDFGLSDEYLAGYSARLNGHPFNNNETDDWKMGWLNANQALESKMDERDWWIELDERINIAEDTGYYSVFLTFDEAREIIKLLQELDDMKVNDIT